jgi:hypothetical protein
MSNTTVANETHIGRDVPDKIAFPLMLKRMMKRINKVASGCWEWTGAVREPGGYAWVTFKGKQIVAHRMMHTIVKGPVPKGMDCCHSCDNRKCVNPDHLWIGTRQENLLDASSKGRVFCQKKTHCTRGHAYAEHGVRHGKDQWRQCRICARGRQRVRQGWGEAEAYSVPAIPQDAPTARRKWKQKVAA